MTEKKITCIIVDDEPLAVSLLESYTNTCTDTTLLQTFTNPFDALQYLASNKPDLIFLDVQMPELSGIQFMKVLQMKCPIVLTTAYPDYAVNAFDLDVIDYLLKPVSYNRFTRAVDKVKDKLATVLPTSENAELSQWFYIKSDRKMIKIYYEDVLYLEGLRDYVAVHTKNGKHLTLQNMKSFEENLPTHKFARIHKSYIINKEEITSLQNNALTIQNITLPIGSVYAQNIKFSDFNKTGC